MSHAFKSYFKTLFSQPQMSSFSRLGTRFVAKYVLDFKAAIRRCCQISFFLPPPADRWRHGVHREDELHPQGPASRQHPRGRQPRVQDCRLRSGQVDRGQRVHGAARWVTVWVTGKKWIKWWPLGGDDSPLCPVVLNEVNSIKQMLLLPLISSIRRAFIEEPLPD